MTTYNSKLYFYFGTIFSLVVVAMMVGNLLYYWTDDDMIIPEYDIAETIAIIIFIFIMIMIILLDPREKD